MTHIVVIEDDDRIRRSLVRALTDRGHDVAATGEGLAGLKLIVEQRPDVVVLDLGLPDIDGVDLLRMVRATSDVPVLVATARDADGDMVRTLDAGADDHVVKPYSIEQLEARIRAVLRRSATTDNATEHAVLVVGDLRIDLAARDATLAGAHLEFTRLEFDLLATLARRPNEVVSRRELFTEVWRQPYGGGDRTLDVHVSWVRGKLGETASAPRYLHTVRGVGFKLVDPHR